MNDDYLDDALDSIQLYQPDNRFLQAFYEFANRLNSLNRHWLSTKQFIFRYMNDLRAMKTNGSWEMDTIRSDIVMSDQEYFPEFLRGAIISHALALMENLLSDVSAEVSSEIGVKQEPDQKKLPYINRYILFLTRTCGLELEVSKDLWKRLDAIRELRNRYIHKLDRDLPLQIKDTLSDITRGALSETRPPDDVYVDVGLQVVADLAKSVETSYWQWYSKLELNG